MQSWFNWTDLKSVNSEVSQEAAHLQLFLSGGSVGQNPNITTLCLDSSLFLLSLLLVRGGTMRSLEGVSSGPSTTTESAECVTWFRLWWDV